MQDYYHSYGLARKRYLYLSFLQVYQYCIHRETTGERLRDEIEGTSFHDYDLDYVDEESSRATENLKTAKTMFDYLDATSQLSKSGAKMVPIPRIG